MRNGRVTIPAGGLEPSRAVCQIIIYLNFLSSANMFREIFFLHHLLFFFCRCALSLCC